MIGALLESLDQRKDFDSLNPREQEMLDRALDKVVEGTESNINLVSGYKRKLHKSILKSLQYADHIIEQIPNPIELGSEQLVANPYVRAFFYTTTGLKKACNKSSELKEFFQSTEYDESSGNFALLCMRKEEESILGMRLEGSHVVRGIQQTRITFSDHHIQSPAEDERTARRKFKCCIFEGLVDNALANISALRSTRQQLETEQQLLSTRLRTHRGESTNVVDLSRIAEDEIRLEQIGQKLHDIGYVTPEVSLDLVNRTLAHPENFINIENISIKLDKEGILRSDQEQSRSINTLDLSEIRIQGHPPRIITLVSIKCEELISTGISFPSII